MITRPARHLGPPGFRPGPGFQKGQPRGVVTCCHGQCGLRRPLQALNPAPQKLLPAIPQGFAPTRVAGPVFGVGPSSPLRLLVSAATLPRNSDPEPGTVGRLAAAQAVAESPERDLENKETAVTSFPNHCGNQERLHVVS